MAQENDEGGYDVGFIRDGELVPYPEEESPYSGNFCVSTDDEGVPDGKIIGLQVAGTRWVNPNQCAQKALEAEQEQLASVHSRPEGDSGGPCGKPPCEHPGRGRKGDDDHWKAHRRGPPDNRGGDEDEGNSGKGRGRRGNLYHGKDHRRGPPDGRGDKGGERGKGRSKRPPR